MVQNIITNGYNKKVWDKRCDNSVWGISYDADIPLVCFGDQREEKQIKREAVAVRNFLENFLSKKVCIKDSSLRNALKSLIVLVDNSFSDPASPITFASNGKVLKDRGLVLAGYQTLCSIWFFMI